MQTFFFEKKFHKCRKKLKGGPFSLSRYGVLRIKGVKPFWFSSLGQMIQFGTIKFCRTFKNYFDQFVWIEKKSHYNSRVSLHEAPTKKRRLEKQNYLFGIDPEESGRVTSPQSNTLGSKIATYYLESNYLGSKMITSMPI